MAGNLGYGTYLIHDACACTNRIGPYGTDHEPEIVHAMSLANLHGEFCIPLITSHALQLLSSDVGDLIRVKGNQ